ncbi:MAG: glycerophosphodiester phosphodiesterase family protein [Terracidiphilus sp.]|nr:glycerophosphodiester phosphodiesterase family protein [Terracidiphilus sp.]
MFGYAGKFAVVTAAGLALVCGGGVRCAGQDAKPAPAPVKILVHGHRGSRATRPENTLPAFRFALEHGVDVLELDLAVTKDNVLVVSHSPYIVQDALAVGHERFCQGPEYPAGTAIHQLTLAEVEKFDCGVGTLKDFPKQVAVPGTHVATFDQVLEVTKGNKVELNVETKIFAAHPELTPSPEEFVRLILDAIHRHHVDESRIILQSFDYRTLKEMRKQDAKIRLSALVGVGQAGYTDGTVDKNTDLDHIQAISGAEIVSPDYHLVTPEQVERVHKAGGQVVPWTANTPADWQKLVDAHVDAIISDDPEALLGWLKAQKPALH